MKISVLSIAAVSAALVAIPAVAVTTAPQVTNGGLEGALVNKAPPGWTALVPTGESFRDFAGASPAGGDNWGIQQLDGWGRINAGGLTQSITGLTIGNSYDISFYSLVNHTSDPKASERWNVTFGDVTQAGTTISTNSVWVKSTLTFVASAVTQPLTFAGQFMNYTPGATPEVLNLDGITLTDVTPPVPEASSLSMLLAGLTIVGLVATRRRTRPDRR